jgi:hypothetical protein
VRPTQPTARGLLKKTEKNYPHPCHTNPGPPRAKKKITMANPFFQADATHGPSQSDHQSDKVLRHDYWDVRVAKLAKQKAPPAVVSHMVAESAAKRRKTQGLPEEAKEAPRNLFEGVCVYFNGLQEGGVSALDLGEMIKHHGGKTR